ncbi:MAG: hypothetical protein ABMA15_22555, partial [Vicinamibacterales bacterium]
DDPRALAEYIWAIVHGMSMLAINGQLGPARAVSDHLNNLVQLAFKRMRTGIAVKLKDAR